MSKRNIVHIEIPAQKPEESAEFYKEMFGWKIVADVEMNYTMWEPEVHPGGGFSQIGEDVKVGDVLVYIDSDDIDADLKKIERLGGKVIYPKTEIPNTGWFAFFQDPVGNTLALYTSMNP